MNLNLYTPINSLGYGVVGTNIAKSLNDLDINVSLFPIGEVNLASQEDVPIFQQLVKNKDTFDYNAPCLKIYHEFSLADKISRGKYFTLSFFELDRLSENRRHHLNSSDVIITPSHWAKNIMVENNIKPPIHVIPMGVDIEIFSPSHHPKSPDDPYVFINISKLEIRKGHDVLPIIFNQAFTDKDNVELWMMVDNPFLTHAETQEWHNYYLSTPLGSKIKFINRVNTSRELAGIIQKADCGIYPSRAEGFNLSALELLSCGKHIIISNYSAHTEYCTNDNSHLIDIDTVEEAMDFKWFGKGTGNEGNWAKIGQKQEEQCVEHMRNLYKNHKGKTNKEGIKTAAGLTWQHCGQKIKSLIFGNQNVRK